MNNSLGKNKNQSISDIKGIIIMLVGSNQLLNVIITNKNGSSYSVISGNMEELGIEINRGMVSNELEHDIVIPYNDIKKIEDRIKKTVIFEDTSE